MNIDDNEKVGYIVDIEIFLKFNDKNIWVKDQTYSIKMNNALQGPLFRLKKNMELRYTDFIHLQKVREIMVGVYFKFPTAADLRFDMIKNYIEKEGNK